MVNRPTGGQGRATLCAKMTKPEVTMMFSPILGKPLVPKLPGKVGGCCDLEEALGDGRCILRLATDGKEELQGENTKLGEIPGHPQWKMQSGCLLEWVDLDPTFT